ncbi:unnamed protein product, partial [Musa hybrid cultivar]
IYKSSNKYKHHHHCSTDCFRAAGRRGSARTTYGERAARLLILSASRIWPKMHELRDNRGKCLGFPPAAAGYDPLSYALNVEMDQRVAPSSLLVNPGPGIAATRR